MPSFTCKDIGMDCSFEATTNTHNELVGKIIEHTESTHNMDVLSADVIMKVKIAIKK